MFFFILSDILRKFENTHEVILPRLTGCYEIMTDPQGRSSLIWIIGEYGEVSSTCNITILFTNIYSL